jgi:hypothetical protein
MDVDRQQATAALAYETYRLSRHCHLPIKPSPYLLSELSTDLLSVGRATG